MVASSCLGGGSSDETGSGPASSLRHLRVRHLLTLPAGEAVRSETARDPTDSSGEGHSDGRVRDRGVRDGTVMIRW